MKETKSPPGTTALLFDEKSSRRKFIRAAAFSAAVLGGGGTLRTFAAEEKRRPGNPLPRWRGFNLTDFTSPNPSSSRRDTADDDFKWIVDWGFDFIRLPVAYPRYLDFDRSKPLVPEDVDKFNEQEMERIDKFVRKANAHGLHVSLNLHRAPGYCVNAGFREPFDLWKSKEAQDAFAFHWGAWAKRFNDVPSAKLSFDLLNEPAMRADMNNQTSPSAGVPGDLYRTVAKGAVDAIRSATSDRIVIADGNRMGSEVVPELKNLGIGQGCRGYFPGYISHYKAPWANKDPEKCPTPVWPGTMNNEQFGRERLEKFYHPWIELVKSGVGVHCGESGCWNKTPHEVFLAWFDDVLDILTENRIGYALWNFRGDFGILDSGRQDVDYQEWHGHKLDSKLLELLKKH